MCMTRPRGTLKITASHGIGAYWLLPRLGEFLAEYPEVEVHLVMDDQELDLAQREADLAIRMRAPVQADLIQRKLFTVHYHIYASKAYLQEHPAAQVAGGDRRPHHHRLWRNRRRRKSATSTGCSKPSRKTPSRAARAASSASTTSPASCRRSEAGLGIGVVPDYVAAEHPELVRVLPDVAAPGFDVHLVYADALRQSKRVAAFRDFAGQVLEGLAVLGSAVVAGATTGWL